MRRVVPTHRQGHKLRVVTVRVRFATVSQVHHRLPLVDRLAECLLVLSDPAEQVRGDQPHAGPLVGQAEDARQAGNPAPAKAISRMTSTLNSRMMFQTISSVQSMTMRQWST